jgi:hypothetical protein
MSSTLASAVSKKNSSQINQKVNQNDVEKGANMKRTYATVIAIALALAVVAGGSRLLAHADTESGGISLKKLAGSFAGEVEANFGICLTADFSALQDCATTPADHIIPWHENATTQGTVDAAGNFCYDEIQTNAPVFPGPQAAQVNHYIDVGVVTSYNPSTGSGDNSFKIYVAGPGVKCNGSTFVNTDNATAVVSVTIHFVASNNGNRLDSVVRTIQLSPINGVSGFVGHGFAVRQ